MKLFEGLEEHDLDFTIMPIISIDEYKSKIDDRKAIVVGFYITENDPAVDLAAFIEKGIVKVLDTDVSPAPTDDGYYLVFIELDRDDKFPEKLLKIIDEIGNITNIKDWEFSPLHSAQDENYPLTIVELRKHINLDPDSVEISDDNDDESNDEVTIDDDKDNADIPATMEQIALFLKHSLVESYTIDSSNVITLEQQGIERIYKVVKIDYDEPDIPILIGSIGDPRLFESSRLQSMLGQNYSVYSSGTHLLVEDDSGYMLLTPLN
jgi:hypothetical protein